MTRPLQGGARQERKWLCGRPAKDRSCMKKVAIAVVALCALIWAPNAGAAIPSVFGGQVSCSVQGDGVRFCGSSSPRSTAKTFDGVPIDVNVAFPPQPASGPDGNY